MTWLRLVVGVALCGAVTGVRAEPVELVRNGGFEDGLAGWSVGHTWFVGTGQGLAATTVVETTPHAGAKCFEIAGTGNRAIAMQILPAFPTTYQVSGWIRCEGLGATQAVLQLEWKGEGDRYIGGEAVGSVTGDSPWTRVEKPVSPPADAVTMLVEVLTTAPNDGHAWFDDVSVRDLAEPDTAPPPVVAFAADSPPGMSGAARLQWPDWQAPPDTARFEVFVADAAFTTVGNRAPVTTVGRLARSAVVEGLVCGRTYFVAVAAADRFGNRQQVVECREVIPVDRKPPHAITPTVTALVATEPSVLVEWEPFPIDDDIATFTMLTRSGADAPPSPAPEPAVGQRRLVVQVAGEKAPREVAVVATDAAGNASDPVWVPVPVAFGTPPAAGGMSARAPDGNAVAAKVWAQPLERAGGPEPFRQDLAAGLYRLWAEADGYYASAPVLAYLGAGPVAHTFAVEPRTDSARAWAASALDKVFQDATPPAASGAIRLAAARNQTVSSQFVVRSEEPLGDASLWSTALAPDRGGPAIPAESVSLSFVGYVNVKENSKATPVDQLVRKAPADFPDPLLADKTRPLEAGRAQPIFVQVRVARGTQPGLYRGRVWLSTATISLPVEIEVEVFGVDLPERTRLLVTTWFSTQAIAKQHGVEEWSEDHWRWLGLYARVMAAHHQNIAMAPLSLIRSMAEEGGGYTFDYSRFDRWVELFDAAGVDARIELSHLGGRKTGEWECPEFVFGDIAATARNDGAPTTVPVPVFIHALQEHLRERGWLARSLQHIADEPIPVNENSWRERSREVHAAAPDLARIDAVHVTDLDGDLEVWVPQLNFYSDAYQALKDKHDQGIAEVWFYIAWVPQGKFPNRLIDMETIRTRIIHWMNYVYGAPGYLHWGLNHWGIDFGHFSPGDEWIMWPGERGPLSSLRYEAQREGIEDHELLSMLEDQRKAAGDADPSAPSRELAGRLIRSVTDYDMDPAKLDEVRRELMKELASGGGGG